MKILLISLLSLFASLNSGVAMADAKQEIIARCRTSMGEYGSMMVKSCVDQDLTALIALNKYQKRHGSIIGRCMNTMEEYGYMMVKSCVDQDIKAEKELGDY